MLAVTLTGCSDEATRSPFGPQEEELEEPIGSPDPGHDPNPCAGRDIDGPVVIEGPEPGWEVPISFIAYGCSTGSWLDWQLLVSGVPVAVGTEDTWNNGHPRYFEFIVEADHVHVGRTATLEVMSQDDPPSRVEVKLTEPIGEVILPEGGP